MDDLNEGCIINIILSISTVFNPRHFVQEPEYIYSSAKVDLIRGIACPAIGMGINLDIHLVCSVIY